MQVPGVIKSGPGANVPKVKIKSKRFLFFSFCGHGRDWTGKWLWMNRHPSLCNAEGDIHRSWSRPKSSYQTIPEHSHGSRSGEPTSDEEHARNGQVASPDAFGQLSTSVTTVVYVLLLGESPPLGLTMAILTFRARRIHIQCRWDSGYSGSWENLV